MRFIASAQEMTQWSLSLRRSGKKVAFIPTMGALHEGHLALFRYGKGIGDRTVVSIFVNPTQFNSPIDYKRYPRDLKADLQKCRRVGVDAAFAPTEDEIYPQGQGRKKIALPAVARVLEGRSRPGHFAGVVQVVDRLFQIVRPHVAVFGQKDFQQMRVIEEMVRREKIPVRIVSHPIVRDRNGLALSSRNERLSAKGRRTALSLSRSLRSIEAIFFRGERRVRELEKIGSRQLKGKGSTKDYLKIVHAKTLRPVSVIRRQALAAVAAFVEGVRLIDNCLLDPTEIKVKLK